VGGNVIAVVVSVMGIFNGAGRLIFSAASDKLKARITMYRVISVLSIMSVALAIAVKSEWAIMVSLVVISACYGAGFSCLPSMLSDIYGMKNISKIHGAELSSWAIAGLTGNQISNLIHDITGDYNKVFVVLLILYTIEFLIALRIKYRKVITND
jgi:OFA family oxalate/formate antiporter-like MFS transporter